MYTLNAFSSLYFVFLCPGITKKSASHHSELKPTPAFNNKYGVESFFSTYTDIFNKIQHILANVGKLSSAKCKIFAPSPRA